jgi:phosphatidylcholine synthase
MSDAPTPSPPASLSQRALAWSVHLFTASGAFLALLALDAIHRNRWHEALLWLFAALVVDSVDGSLARAAKTKRFASRVDGDVLDLVIDYLTYVVIPTLFLWRAGLVPVDWAFPLGALIQLSSLYIFARRDMKTDDGYFRGFPALWNVVALYLFVTDAGPSIGAATVVLFSLMSFAPVHVVHPFRVRDYGWMLPVLALIWAAATLPLLFPAVDGAIRGLLLLMSVVASAVLIALGLWRSFRGAARTSHNSLTT